MRTILECTIQTRDSNNFLPFTISKENQTDIPLGGMGNNTISYSDYVNVIKKQVSYAKSIYDILSDSARQIRAEPPPPQPMMPPQALQQQQQILPQMSQQPLQHMGPVSGPAIGQVGPTSHQIQQQLQ